MPLSSNESIEIVTYTNPCHDEIEQDIDVFVLLDFFENEEKARTKAGIEGFFHGRDYDKESLGELLQRKYASCLTTSPEIDEWYNSISNWIPSSTEEWWLNQFENSETLDSMPQEWWRLRTRKLIAGYEDGDIARPLASFAITKVYAHERFKSLIANAPFEHALFYEARGLAVDYSCQGRGLGRMVTEETLNQIAILEERLPTFAITTNPIAAKIFQKIGATNKPTREEFPFKAVPASHYNQVACWSRFEEEPPYCVACPVKSNTAWWWATHRNP
jgi:ribosomal protein S18 acetylase RimI-like enzyme